jgi:hypothetical protein
MCLSAVYLEGVEFVKIQRERAVDAVYQALRQAIVGCRM